MGYAAVSSLILYNSLAAEGLKVTVADFKRIWPIMRIEANDKEPAPY